MKKVPAVWGTGKLLIKLTWSSPVDLDLICFYTTKDGRRGGLFSERYPGGSSGSLDAFPYMKLSEDVGSETDTEIKEESLQISKLQEMKEIYFCAVNFSDASRGEETSLDHTGFCSFEHYQNIYQSFRYNGTGSEGRFL